MLVRDAEDSWQVVLQTDHGDLAGAFARAWFPRPEPFTSLETVACRHDDGWSVWERAPNLDEQGRPCNYLDVQVPSHLAFYRAAIVAVTEHDPYAGLILSMHGAGIYRQRYGVQPDLRMTFVDEVKELAEAFVAEQEAGYATRMHSLRIDDEERWRSYKLLQVWDRLSLYVCLSDLESGAGRTIACVPLNGVEESLTLTPGGDGTVKVTPFPFAGDSVELSVPRRLLPKRSWADADDFRTDFFDAPVEPLRVLMVRA